jgi:hypothetical protein
MKAALLEAFGQPLRIADVPDPTLGTGEVTVAGGGDPGGGWRRQPPEC